MAENSDQSKPNGMRNVYAMGLVSFFTDFSTEMILGILPFFIVVGLGASRAVLGTIEGSAELVSYAFRIVSGSISDKTTKRKPFIIAGYGLSTISKPFFSASSGWLDAFAVRATDRIGKGLRTPPRDALIADSVSIENAGKAFGFHRTLDQAGAIVGPLVAFALLQFIDIRGVFIMSLIPGAIAVLILIFVVKEVVIKKHPTANIFANMKQVVHGNKPFVMLLVISCIFSLGAFNFSFVLLKASDMGVEKNFIPIVYAVINIAHTIIGIPSGFLADRIGKEKVLLIGYGVFGISTVLMVILSGNALYAYLLAGVFGVYMGISETVQRAVIPRYVSSELRGTAFGIFSIVIGAGFFVGNVLFGFLWDNSGLASAVMYSVILTLIAMCSMIGFLRKYPENLNSSK
jgi:MFS family permease